MIADWTVEIGPDSPSIEVPWDGWVDLHLHKGEAALPEVVQYPELGTLLRYANNEETLTSKSDVFSVSRKEVDPEIAEYGETATAFGLGSYLDLLPARQSVFDSFPVFEQTARETAEVLRRAGEPQGVAEIVIRPARLYDEHTFGWTLYAIGFGPSAAAARLCWHRVNTRLLYRMHLSVAAAPARRSLEAGAAAK